MNLYTSPAQNLRTDAAAHYLGVSPSLLAKLRMRGEGPQFVKLGRRVVVYRVADLTAWLDAGQRTSTAE